MQQLNYKPLPASQETFRDRTIMVFLAVFAIKET